MKKATLFLVFLPFVFFNGCGKKKEVHSPGESVTVESSSLSRLVNVVLSDEELIGALRDGAVGSKEKKALKDIVKHTCDLEVVSEFFEEHPTFGVTENETMISEFFAAMSDAEKHGSDFEPAHLGTIREKVDKISSIVERSKSENIVISENDKQFLIDKLKSENFDADRKDAGKALKDRLLGGDLSLYLPELRRYLEIRNNNLGAIGSEADNVNALVACNLVKWAKVLRLDYNRNLYTDDRFESTYLAERLPDIRAKVFLGDVRERGIKRALAQIEPPYEQYRKLIAARERYVNAPKTWTAIGKVGSNAVVGKRYAFVPLLRKRLSEEGYDGGDLQSDMYDDALDDQVLLYRELHQLNTKKNVDATLVKNLAKPAAERLASIDVTLQRFRESPLGTLDYYVYVNIPDFHAELWRDNQRLMRFRIIVGKNNKELDPETKKPVRDPVTKDFVYPNRTPLISAKMNEIIYNPYWNVPERIRVQELEPHLAENPNWYAEHRYEEVNVDNPKLYYVRKLPGPGNDLGRVKFMFPNKHAVYLHDTPAKSVFKNPLRANSHGCMRVQDPLLFAERLLKEDNQWNANEVRSILNANPLVETSIMLKRPVDVVIEYFNARVDDTGHVAFHSDPYEYDVEAVKRYLKKREKP